MTRRVLLFSASFAVLLLAGRTPPASAIIIDGNIETTLRPVVTINYPDRGGNPVERTAVGIFDSGDSRETLSKETASFLGIPLLGPVNQGAAAAQPITSRGWFGSVLDPPERNTAAADPNLGTRAGDPTHIFTSAGTARTIETTSAGIRPFIRDFNNNFSENHNSMVFVTRSDPRANSVVMIDPINGTPLPFAYDNTNAGNGRGLGAAQLPGDQLASSVTYLANDDPRVPIPGRNDNPGFVRFVPLTAREQATTTLTPAPGNATTNAALAVDRQLTINISNADAANFDHFVLNPAAMGGLDLFYRPADAAGTPFAETFNYEVRNDNIRIGGQVNPNGFQRRDGSVRVVVRDAGGNLVAQQDFALPSQAPRPEGSINIPGLAINTGAAGLIDTGAPSASATIAVGTDVLNRFGQFFDFANNRLALIGPEDARIRELRGSGILFNVGAGSPGLAGTAVEQEKLHGQIPQLQGNAVAGTGAATLNPSGAQAPQSLTFRTHLTGSDAAYVDPAAISLARGQIVDSLSLGADDIKPVIKLFFSVDTSSSGQPGSATAGQKALHQHQSDIFEVPFGQPNPTRTPLSNQLTINQEVMGLGPNFGPMTDALDNSRDNLRDFDLLTQKALPNQALSNLDSPIVRKNDTGTVNRPRVGNDLLAINFDEYFSIAGGEDIFKSDTGIIFARGFQDIGLSSTAADDIDALALFRPSVGPGTIGSNTLLRGLNPGIDAFRGGAQTDLALFSLAPGSATLAAGGFSAADIFITDFDGTFTLFASAESLGLLFADNVDGLDSLAFVSEPSTLITLFSGLLGVFLVLRRRDRRARSTCTLTIKTPCSAKRSAVAQGMPRDRLVRR